MILVPGGDPAARVAYDGPFRVELQSPGTGRGAVRIWRAAEPAVVETVMITVAVIWFSEAGLKLQEAPTGKPLQEKVMAPKPLPLVEPLRLPTITVPA